MPDRPSVHVHLLPSLIPPGTLTGGVAVVVDVLRATSVMVHALASGCRAIIPCLEIDDARAAAASLPPGTAILAGERQGVPIEGFDLGNSPGDFTPEVCRGKTLVMTTTNGTRAILASLDAERVLIGAFVNRGALTRILESTGRPIHIVCAGTDGQISVEDLLMAGALVDSLGEFGWPRGNDEAEIARKLWHDIENRRGDAYRLVDAISWGRGGRRVRELGLVPDIEAASDEDRFQLVPEIRVDPTRIVASVAT